MKQGFNVVGKKAFLSRLQRLARTNFLQSLWAVQLWGRNNNFQTFFPECSIEDVNSFSTQKRKITFCQKIGFILFFSRKAFLISCLDYFYEKSAPFPHHPPRALDSLKSSFQKWQSFIEMSLFSRGVVGRFWGCLFKRNHFCISWCQKRAGIANNFGFICMTWSVEAGRKTFAKFYPYWILKLLFPK